MIKIAFIILCHKNAEQINTMIHQIDNENFDFYLHIDKKSNIEDKIIKKQNIYILPKEKSYSISWGGNDMVKATLKMMSIIKDKKMAYDYIWLISGQDFPIIDKESIIAKLEEDKTINYINVLEHNEIYRTYKKLYEVWYPKWIIKNHIIIKIIKRIYMFLTGGFKNTFKFFVRKKNFDFDFEIGSQWWTLTYDCAMYIVDYCAKNPGYINYFNNCIIPDECFFQTLFMNSPFKNQRNENLCYVNWGNNRRSPEILTIKDKRKLDVLKDKYCFARKFDSKVDNEIIDVLKFY